MEENKNVVVEEQETVVSEGKKSSRRHHRGRRKRNAKKQFLNNLILVIAIGVFCFSAYKLYSIWAEYKEIDENYEEIRDIVLQGNPSASTDEEQEEKFSVDFDKLLEINDDVVGWIRFEQPEDISYPIALGKTNKTYLRTDLNMKYSTAGTIFVDYRNSGDFNDENTFVYGHNMRNGSMFGQLKKYNDKDFYKAHPYFYIYTPDGREMIYQIFSIHIVKDTSDVFDFQYESEQEYKEYLEKIKKDSKFDSDVEVTTDSQIVSLSTCSKTADEDRLVIHAVKIVEMTADSGASAAAEE